MAGLVSADAKHELNRIQANTLIVWGDRDPLWTRSEQDGLMRAIRAARQITYADAGHSPHWEQPARFAADLLDFLGEQVAPAAASARNRAVQYGTKRPGGAR
jgi:pimeloyl-ACP methyl ester carboxylesterase